MKSPDGHEHPFARWLLIVAMLLALSCAPAKAERTLRLALGNLNDAAYLSDLLTQVLEQEGFEVSVERTASLPNNRLEWMLAKGEISAMMLGQTPSRDSRFLPVEVDMTDNLIGQRILFIPKGRQYQYDGIEDLEDIRQRQLTAGMGTTWLDYRIWKHNDLPVIGLSGDWKLLFGMVAAGNRGIDYLPRGANEMTLEWFHHPELVMEQNLALVYDKDHILYVSPQRPELYQILKRVLPEAQTNGLIHELVRKHYPEVYQTPVSLDNRRVIHLDMPDSSDPLQER